MADAPNEIHEAMAIADSLQGDVEILAEAIANAIYESGYTGNVDIIHDTIIRRLRKSLSNAPSLTK